MSLNPDLAINLGDSIRDTAKKYHDIQLLELSLSVFAQISTKKIFISGNHEYKVLTKLDVEQIMKKLGINNEMSGETRIGDTKIIWIDSVIGKKDIASIHPATLEWLDDVVENDSNVVFLSHYSVAPIDGKDNFYFATGPEYMTYTNGSEVLKILERCRSAITINAHTHMSTNSMKGKVKCLSLLSFSENIVAMKYLDANPGIYHTLEIEGDRRILRSYSGDFCFLSTEL